MRLDRFKTDGSATRVDPCGVLQMRRRVVAGTCCDLRAEDLRLALRQQHPVGEMGEVGR
jgi:hypothetical protein